MKRIRTCIVLLALLIGLTTNSCLAANEIRYVGIGNIDIQLSINASGTAKCIVAAAPSSNQYTSSITATLKKSTDEKNWSFAKSWSSSGSFPVGAAINETVTVPRGYTYKLFVTVKTHNSEGTLVETAYKSSRAAKF